MSDRLLLSPLWWPRFWRSRAMLAVCVLMGVMFWWTLQWMTVRWDEVNSYYSHGWLIAPIVLVLLYRKRKQLAGAAVRPCRWGLAVLLPSLLLHVLGTAWDVGFISGFSLIGVLVGLVLSLFGVEVLRLLLFPLLFLAFMVPLPALAVDTLSFRLKLLAARFAVDALSVVGLAAVREGSYIRIPTGTVVVDDVCSGLKYLISLTAFGALYAYISPVRLGQKFVLFLVSVPISFAANVLRVTLMVLIGYFWGIETSEKWYLHDTFGFVLFAVAFIMLFVTEALILRRSRRGGGEADRAQQARPAQEPAPTVSYGRMVRVSLAALSVVAALTVFLVWPRATAPASDVLARVPLDLGPWHGTELRLDQHTYDVLGTSDVLSRVYNDQAGHRVQLVVVMAQQTRKRTHPPEQCYVGDGYVILTRAPHPVTLTAPADPKPLDVEELLLSLHEQDLLVWYFYKSGDHLTTSYWRHQSGLALGKLARSDAADILVRVDTPAPAGDPEAARQTLSSFLSYAFPDLTTRLP